MEEVKGQAVGNRGKSSHRGRGGLPTFQGPLGSVAGGGNPEIPASTCVGWSWGIGGEGRRWCGEVRSRQLSEGRDARFGASREERAVPGRVPILRHRLCWPPLGSASERQGDSPWWGKAVCSCDLTGRGQVQVADERNPADPGSLTKPDWDCLLGAFHKGTRKYLHQRWAHHFSLPLELLLKVEAATLGQGHLQPGGASGPGDPEPAWARRKSSAIPAKGDKH